MSFDNSAVENERNVYCCRVCLDAKHSSAQNFGKGSHILQLLEYCVGFPVHVQYNSLMLCVKCEEKIKKFAKFKKQVVKSVQFWESQSILKKFKYDEVNCAKELQKTLKEESTEECEEFNYEECKEDFVTIDKKPSIEIKNLEQSINDKFQNCLNKNKVKDDCNINYGNDDRKIYECISCKKKYNKYKWLVTHMRKDSCKDNLRKNALKTYVKTDNIDYKNIKLSSNGCGLCNLSFSCGLKEHLDHHWYKNDLNCELCNYCGKDFANMITHRYIHCPKIKLRCYACDKKKASILSLQFHFRSVHMHKPGGYCSICDKTFKIFKTWKRHHRLHTENNLFVCEHCNRKFLYRHEIQSHLNDHSDLRHFICETCGKSFKRISSLREHIDNLHTKREPVKCGHCNKIYKCNNQLKVHLRNIAKDKPFVCDVCSKQFYTEAILKKHMFWHTDERPFTCEVCGSKYKAKGQLKVHMRNHTGVMPHKCPCCSKAFATGTQLKRHKGIHTSVGAFKCLHCERSFHVKKFLLKHTELHKVESVKLESKVSSFNITCQQ